MNAHRPRIAQFINTGSRKFRISSESAAENARAIERRERGRPSDERRRRARDPLAARVVVVVEVEAHERLADAPAHEDAREDHCRQQRFGRAVGLRADVVRVERQRQQRQPLGDDVAELVRRPGRHEALEVAEHGWDATSRYAGRGGRRGGGRLRGALAGLARGLARPHRPARARERHADRQQRPRERVLEEVRVGPRVHHERREARRERDPRRRAPRIGEEREQGDDDQRHVDREPEQALLGGDRDRDRVRGGDGVLRRRLAGTRVALVLGFERAGAVALQRPVPEQFEPAFDQARAPRGRAVRRAAFQMSALRREQQHGHRERHERRGDEHRPARAPAVGGEHGEPEQQPGDARLREARHEPREQPREHRRARLNLSSRPPQDDRGHDQHHEHQEASVDARVEEDRVDAEVVVVLVRGDELRVQEQALAVVLDEPDPGQHDRDRDEDQQRAAQQARRPAHFPQQHEQQRERHVEERRGSRPPSHGRPSRRSAACRARPRRAAPTRCRRRRGCRAIAAGSSSASSPRSPRRRGSRCANVPAATTTYSGTSRLTVRPSAEIGTRNGSARIARSGNASG